MTPVEESCEVRVRLWEHKNWQIGWFLLSALCFGTDVNELDDMCVCHSAQAASLPEDILPFVLAVFVDFQHYALAAFRTIAPGITREDNLAVSPLAKCAHDLGSIVKRGHPDNGVHSDKLCLGQYNTIYSTVQYIEIVNHIDIGSPMLLSLIHI